MPDTTLQGKPTDEIQVTHLRLILLLPLRLKVPAEVTTDLHVLNLPFARRPRQVPRVLAMGVWSPHSADPNGSADTGAAQTLWIEFERALSVHAAHPTRGLKYFARWCRSDDEEPEFNLTARRAEAGSAWTEISAWSFDRHTQTAENHTTENHLCAAHAMTELAPALPTAHTQPTQVDDAAQTHEVSRWLLPLPLSLPINSKTAAPPARRDMADTPNLSFRLTNPAPSTLPASHSTQTPPHHRHPARGDASSASFARSTSSSASAV